MESTPGRSEPDNVTSEWPTGSDFSIGEIWDQFQTQEYKCEIGGDCLIEEKFLPDAPPPPAQEEPTLEESKLFICKFCSKLFKSYTLLSNHLKGKCRDVSFFCQFCSKPFTDPSFDYSTHLEECKLKMKGGRFICQIDGCLIEFNSKYKLMLHQKFHCKYCGFNLSRLSTRLSKKSIKKHEDKCHPESDKTLKDPIKSSPKKSVGRSIGRPRTKSRIKLEGESSQNLYRCKRKKVNPPEVIERLKRSTRKPVDYFKLNKIGIKDAQDANASSSARNDEEMSESPPNSPEVENIQSPEVKDHSSSSSVDPTSLFHCKNCLQSYDSKEELKAHREICLQITISGKLIKCPNCSETFPKDFPSKYNSHLDQKHSEERDCKICGKISKSRELLKRHSKLPHLIPCGKCHLKFVGEREFNQHIFNSHMKIQMIDTNTITMLPCPHENCRAKFKSSTNLEMHIQKFHEKKYSFECPMCLQSQSGVSVSMIYEHLNRHKIKTEGTKVECQLCHLFFQDQGQLEAHEGCEFHLAKIKKGDDKLEKGPSSSTLEAHHDAQNSDLRMDVNDIFVNASDAESFPCQDCDRSFTNNALRRKHQQAFHGLAQEYFHCDLCDLVFNEMFELEFHLANFPGHQDEKKPIL